MNFRKIVVIGGGVLGSQIAFQSAYCGYDVTIWLRRQDSIGRCQPRLDKLKEDYISDICLMDTEEGKTFQNWRRGISDMDTFNKEDCLAKVEKAYSSIKLELDPQKAVEDADLVIEAMSEIENEKIDIFKKFAPLLPKKTVLVTNSSSLLPSKFVKYTGRPDKFLALHFANTIRKNNTAEVMAQSKTDMVHFDEVMDFATSIRMIALPVRKEKAGYLLNSMLIPFLFSALDLLVTGTSDCKSIDTAWKLGTGAPRGPFEILDIVGLKTAANIVGNYTHIPSFLAPYHFKDMKKLLDSYVEEGKTGIEKGEGFYKYN